MPKNNIIPFPGNNKNENEIKMCTLCNKYPVYQDCKICEYCLNDTLEILDDNITQAVYSAAEYCSKDVLKQILIVQLYDIEKGMYHKF